MVRRRRCEGAGGGSALIGGPSIDANYDVVVIGSGFGGAITACRLAQAGRSVCVLERGKRWSGNMFPRSLAQVGDQAIWRDGENYGFVEYKMFGSIDVIQGSAVGGGSIHYFNVNLRASPAIFMRPEWPARLRGETLSPYYELAEEMLGSRKLAPPTGFEMPRRTQTFREACDAVGRKSELVPIAVHTGAPRLNPHSGLPQQTCDFEGNCLLGCRVQAKNSLDLTYLAMAERKHGLQVHPLHEVYALEPAPQGGYRVVYDQLPPTPGGEKQRGSVHAKQVVLAAGTLGSTHILLRSRDVTKTLPGLSPLLGKRFSGNGDMLFAGTLDSEQIVDPGQGPAITIGADFSRPGSSQHIFIEDLGFPNPFFWLLEGRLQAPAGRAQPPPSSHPIVRHINDLFGRNRTARFMPYLGMGTDAGDGEMSLDERGDLRLHWDNTGSAAMFEEMFAGMEELSKAMGGKFFPSFLWNDGGRLLTAHPLGGCVMGENQDAGVVSDVGEVHGYPGLFVADGAIMPGATAVNPSLTIAALAERIAYWMVHGKELTARQPTPVNERP